MSTPFYQPADKVQLPPPNAEVITTACDYCAVGCGYKVFRWPARGPQGGPKASENAFGVDFPTPPTGWWVSPNQINQVQANGKLYNIAVVPDKDARVVNVNGGHSIRGGCLARKVYNPHTPTSDRLKHPMIRIFDILVPVSWDFALDIMAEVSKHVLRNALLPTITVIAISIGWLISGLIVIENVFNYPGLGRLMVFAIDRRDLPTLQAITMITVLVFALANLTADLLYTWLNPRVRLD